MAHERTLLDRLTDPEDEQVLTLQSLLVLEVVQLPPQDPAEAADSLEELSVYGFEVERFGKDSLRMQGVLYNDEARGLGGAFRDVDSATKGIASNMSREGSVLVSIRLLTAIRWPFVSLTVPLREPGPYESAVLSLPVPHCPSLSVK